LQEILQVIVLLSFDVIKVRDFHFIIEVVHNEPNVSWYYMKEFDEMIRKEVVKTFVLALL
jgi:hypothetical protein